MLADPLAYLRNRNTALDAVATGAVLYVYNTALTAIAQAVSGAPGGDAANDAAKNLLWVKWLASDQAKQKVAADLLKVDVQFPIQDEAYKAQKSKNKRDLQAKKEIVSEGV